MVLRAFVKSSDSDHSDRWRFDLEGVQAHAMIESRIVMIVGPTGSGKSTLAEFLARSDRFKVFANYTTRLPRTTDSPQHFNFLTEAEFRSLQSSGHFFLSCRKRSRSYGYSKRELTDLLGTERRGLLMFRHNGAAFLHAIRPRIPLIVLEGLAARMLLGTQETENAPGLDAVTRQIERNRILTQTSKAAGSATFIVQNDYTLASLEQAADEISTCLLSQDSC